MFVVTEADVAVLRTAMDEGGDLAAAVELRRLFPGVTDSMRARECARTIAGWKPLPIAADRSSGRLAITTCDLVFVSPAVPVETR